MRIFLVLIMLLFCSCVEPKEKQELKVGQIWDLYVGGYYYDKYDPFRDKTQNKIPNLKYKILDIKDGYVLYECIFLDIKGYLKTPTKPESNKINDFLSMDVKLSKYEVR